MKRKMLMFLCTLIFAVCTAIGFTACGDNTDVSGNGGGGNGDGTEQGGNEQKPDDSQGNDIHKHTLTLVDENTATCIADGNTAYYTCSGCDKWFSDKNGTTEITDKTSVVIAKSHKLTPVDENTATCDADGNTAYYTCSGCDKWFSDKDGTTEIKAKDSVVIAKGHKLTLVDENTATCITEGNTVYYTCSGCDKWFSDKDGKTEITDKASVVIGKAEHTYNGSTCGVCGAHKTTEGLAFKLSGDKTYYICSGIDEVTDVDIVIPSKHNEKPVASIGHGAFSNNKVIESVVIPDGVTTIESSAFGGCSNLTSIEIPDSVISIDKYVFQSCTSLTSITIPDSVTSIGDYALSVCTSLTSITIPDSVTSIGDYALAFCSKLESVTLGSGITSISSGLFSDCSSLKSITISGSVTSIGGWVLYDCSSLTDIYFGGTQEQWEVIEKDGAWNNYTIHFKDEE